MSIKVFPTQKKLTDDDAKLDVGHKHVTGQEMLGGKVGLDVLPKAIFPVDGSVLSTRTVDAGSSDRIVVSAGHTAKKGDVLRFTSGALQGIEAPVNAIDGDDIILATELDSAPLAGDEFLVMRHITLTIDENGALTVQPGPAQFVKDSIETQVNYDTVTPANNTPMPNQLFVMKDGVVYPVEKDTVTPANTLSIPVEIVGTSGTEINITAGDIGVQLQHSGANPDSVQIGDGTEIMAINASNEALVHDTDMLAELNAISNDQLVASLGRLADTASSSVALSNEDKAVLDAIDTSLNNIETSASNIDGKLPATLGQKLSAASLAVVIASDQSNLTVDLPTGAATEAKQDSAITKLTEIDTAIDLMSAKLPSALGRLADTASMSVALSNEDKAVLDAIDTVLDSIKVDTGVIAADTTSIDGKLNSLGQKASAASMPVVLSSEQEAMIDGLEALLTTIDADTSNIATDTATIASDTTSIDGKLPTTIGQKADAASLAVTLSTEQQTLLEAIRDAAQDVSNDSVLALGDVDTSTLTSAYANVLAIPANFKIVKYVNNSGNTIRLTIASDGSDLALIAPGETGELPMNHLAGVDQLQAKSLAATGEAGNLYLNLIG